MCMYSTISPKLVDMVIDDSMLTHEVWKRLQDIFHDNKDTKTIQLGIQIRSMNIGNLSVTEYFQAINSKADRLSNFGSTFKLWVIKKTRVGYRREYIPRDREVAEQRLLKDYFGDENNPPKYPEKNFGRRQLKRRGKNYPTLKLEAVASQDLWIWHAYFGVLEENNDFNVLYGSSLYDDILVDKALEAPFVVKFAAKLKALRMIRSYMRKKMRKQVLKVLCVEDVGVFTGRVSGAMHASVVKGLIDGGVNVFEQQESEGKWSTSPPAENGAGPSRDCSNGHIKWACHSAEGQMVLLNGGKDDKVMLAYAYGLEASQEPVTKYRVLGPIISGCSLRSIRSRNS
ncbi:zinc finger, CCHC-type containing protein [Tanacetum coccineum]